MAGLTPDTPVPTRIVVHRKSREVEIAFSDGLETRLSFEFLRVHSPSAEVRGHGPGQETLQVGKRDVDILAVDPVGHYAIQPRFSDGHESGIYSWDWLHRFALEREPMWQKYLEQLAAAGASREPAATPAGKSPEAPAIVASSGCGGGARQATPASPAQPAPAQTNPAATRQDTGAFAAVAVSRPRSGGG